MMMSLEGKLKVGTLQLEYQELVVLVLKAVSLICIRSTHVLLITSTLTGFLLQRLPL